MTELLTPSPHPTAAPAAPPPGNAAAALAELRAVLPGRVLAPGDPGWDTARLGWVVNVAQHPLAVVTVRDADDVAAVVRCARRHEVRVAAQPVGHGATGAASGTILLRTHELQELAVDPEKRAVRVGAGVRWGRLLEALEPTGLVAAAGSNPDPSVVGYLLGGGLSWFSRAFGLAAHDVTALEIVDADGNHRGVTADDDPDLLWALRGGGGDFGIVTSVVLRLHDAGPVTGGRMLWPLEMAGPVLQAYRHVTATAPDELTCWAHLFRLPPDPALPPHLRGAALVTVDLTYLGPAGHLDRLLSPLRSVPAMLSDSVGPVPLGQLGSIAAEPVDPMPAMEDAGLLHDVDEASVERLLAVAGAHAELPLAVVQLRHLGGALSRAHAEDGPHGAVEEQYQVFCLGVPAVPELVPAIEAGFHAVRGALQPQLSGRRLFNFLGQSDDLRPAFDHAALDRLRSIKRTADPSGVFRSNRPVLGPACQ